MVVEGVGIAWSALSGCELGGAETGGSASVLEALPLAAGTAEFWCASSVAARGVR